MIRRCIVFAVTFGSAPAFAGPSAQLPEPGSLALLGVGAVAAVVIVVRNRRK